MKHTALATTLLLSSTLLASTAYANMGFVGVEIGKELTVLSDGEGQGFSDDNSLLALHGAYRFELGSNIALIGNARLRKESFGTPPTGQELDDQISASLHALFALNEKTQVGAFYGISKQPHIGSTTEDYENAFYGLELHSSISDRFGFFLQFGAGDEKSTGQSSQGYEGGKFYRAGGYYLLANDATLGLDVEMGSSNLYEDNDEPGQFRSFTITYEDTLPIQENLSYQVGLRSSNFDALNDPEDVNETSVFFGIKFNFGGNSAFEQKKAGLVGDPYTPRRAAAVLPFTD